MDTHALELIRQGDTLFGKRSGLLNLWQAIAENFYVERADFVGDRTAGAEFASHLFGSYPVFARRELGNLFASMLRPRSLQWFSLHVTDKALDKDKETRAYLEYVDGVQWRAIYDAQSQFTNVMVQSDHDLATFGNAVIEISTNRDRAALLYRCHHLRDCAWSENADGAVDTLYRKWHPTARQLVALFPKTVSSETRKLAEKEPETTVDCCQAVVPKRTYQSDRKPGKRTLPFTVFYIEKHSATILEETPEAWFRFVVPRWQRVSGSQYARSPATEIVLPDARTFQVVVRTLREAGEMHVNPPMVGVADALRSDIQLYPGGFTNVDIEFDNDLKNALAPVESNPGTMPIGFEIAAALRDDIRLGFFLDKIKLPEISERTMTAYAIQKRLEEHIRASAPLFEPIEDESSIPICNLTFEVLKANGAFGNPNDIPEKLDKARVEFQIRSPLRDVQDQAKAGLFADGLQRVLLPAAEVDQAQLANANLTVAVRESLTGLGWPAGWLGEEDAVREAQEALAEQKKMMAGIDAMKQGGEAAGMVGQGAAAIGEMAGG